MGTHGYVRVLDENGKLRAAFATQYDGFPDQLGRELVYGLVGKRYVHSYGMDDDQSSLIGDLVVEIAWLLQHYRGNMHIGFLPLEDDPGEGWGVYTVYPVDDKIYIRHAPETGILDETNQDEADDYDGIADPKLVPFAWHTKTPPSGFVEKQSDQKSRKLRFKLPAGYLDEQPER